MIDELEDTADNTKGQMKVLKKENEEFQDEYESIQSENKIFFTIDDGVPLDNKYITDVINGRVKDELHRILRLGYRKRIKPHKKKDYRYW